MWIVAGLLLGSVLLTSLLGFHTGPHSHAISGVLGAIAALWLIIMALEGRSSSVLWALLSADVIVAGGAGVVGWKGLTSQRTGLSSSGPSVVGKQGVATSDLSPEGVVRVRGENWSAVSLNGNVKSGTAVQVIGVSGIRLEVWGEDSGLEVDGDPLALPVALLDDVDEPHDEQSIDHLINDTTEKGNPL